MKAVISEIREQRSGVRITADNGDCFCLRSKDCKKHDLREGDAVDIGELKQQLLLEQYPDALNRAVRLLAVRGRSCFEMEQRLTGACYLPDTVEMVITKLQTNNLLDDRAFAAQWARERTARQIGRTRILYELRQKGVDGALAEAAIAELDVQKQDESLRKLAEKLVRRYQNISAEDARRKTIQAMQRRGYSYGEARRVLDEVYNGTE